ncbi:MAG TPA: hypothetical protein ENK18_24650 [Deltaproteobacteria bacterium]|nr:hypothetical protein [Deltaproteobacteria bacterium]
MRTLPLLAPVLAACAPESRWAQTQAICGFEASALDVAAFASPPRYPSRACVDAVLDDFGLDRGLLLDADGLTDPYTLVEGSSDGQGLIDGLLWSAHALIASDLGTLDAATGIWLTDAFRTTLDDIHRTTGQDALGPLLYDYVTGRIHHTTVEPLDAAAGMRGRTLVLVDLPVGIAGSAVLVHEARHSEGLQHVACGGRMICDPDATGALGFELAVHELARDAADDRVIAEIAETWLETLEVRVLSPPVGAVRRRSR